MLQASKLHGSLSMPSQPASIKELGAIKQAAADKNQEICAENSGLPSVHTQQSEVACFFAISIVRSLRHRPVPGTAVVRFFIIHNFMTAAGE